MKKFEKNFILLCDNASVDSNGKLSINGIFDIIYSKVFPAIHGKSFLVGNFKVLDKTINNIDLNFLLMNPNDSILKLEGAKINIDLSNKSLSDKKANFILELGGLKFDKPGIYKFVVGTNQDEDIGNCEFQLIKPQE